MPIACGRFSDVAKVQFKPTLILVAHEDAIALADRIVVP